MGTRSVTKVISGGEVRLCQYGQFDGYPTCAGVKILEWIKKGDFDAIKNCEFHVMSSGKLTWTGYPYDKEISEMNEAYYDKIHLKVHQSYTYREDADEEMLEEFGEDRFIKFKQASRDTGADILSVITKPVKTYADEYIASLNGANGEIDAFYVIDLDAEKVYMDWRGKEDAWTFKGIQRLSVERTMRRFENDNAGKTFESGRKSD